MQIILREKIRRLGSLGDQVNVKPGYARNFLIPTGKAMMATRANLAKFETERAELERLAAETLATAQKRAEKLKEIVITIAANAGEGGKLFGSIGTRDISEAIGKNGVEVEKHEVRLPNGVIREIGEYEVELHLHTDLNVPVKVNVIPE